MPQELRRRVAVTKHPSGDDYAEWALGLLPSIRVRRLLCFYLSSAGALGWTTTRRDCVCKQALLDLWGNYNASLPGPCLTSAPAWAEGVEWAYS